MEDKIICPECGNSEISKGKLSSHSVLNPVGKIFYTNPPATLILP